MLRTFLCSARWAVTSSSPSGVDRSATQTRLTWGLPSGLSVISVASTPFPMNSRAASLSFMLPPTHGGSFDSRWPPGDQQVQQSAGLLG